MLNIILLVFAFVLLVIESVRRPTWPAFPVSLGWLGLALFVLTFILNGAGFK